MFLAPQIFFCGAKSRRSIFMGMGGSALKSSKFNKKMPLTFTHVLLLLFCAVLITSHFVNGIYAKYSSGINGSDSGRVIYFGDIRISQPNDDINTLIPGISSEKETLVSFDGSEAQTYIFVKISASDEWTYKNGAFYALNDKISISVSGDAWSRLDIDDECLLYLSLAPNEVLLDEQVIYTVSTSENATKTELDSIKSSNISIYATAVQGNGFANAYDAWQSVSNKMGGK